MNTFVDAVESQKTFTENGMPAFVGSLSKCVDLFYKIGSSRGQDITPIFSAAYTENRDLATRIALWARDIRGGAGERQTFRDILNYIEMFNTFPLESLIQKIPEIGRWDDLLHFKSARARNIAYSFIKETLVSGLDAIDGSTDEHERALNTASLCAKWMPRKNLIAVDLRNHFGWSPKYYRKTLVLLTDVVESKMCARQWSSINFSHVPSVAASRYKRAFLRNAPVEFGSYVKALSSGDPQVKINAGAIFPHDVIKVFINSAVEGILPIEDTIKDLVEQQWKALPNYIGDASILPMVDTSGSMYVPTGKNSKVQCIDVALSLGLYCAEKNAGRFNGAFLSFSGAPKLQVLKGSVYERIQQLAGAHWGMNTNIEAAFKTVLNTAKTSNVPAEEMPKIILILSDMQFDHCGGANFSDSAFHMIKRMYKNAGYVMPKIVFWNLNAQHSNVPVRFDTRGAAMVSGFSPALLTAVLSNDLEDFTPEKVMLEAVMKSRYNI